MAHQNISSLASLKNPSGSTYSIASVSSSSLFDGNESDQKSQDSSTENKKTKTNTKKVQGNKSIDDCGFEYFFKLQNDIDIPSEYYDYLEYTQTDKNKKRVMMDVINRLNKDNAKDKKLHWFMFEDYFPKDKKKNEQLKNNKNKYENATDHYFYHLILRSAKALYERNRLNEIEEKTEQMLNLYYKHDFNKILRLEFDNEQELFDRWPLFIHGMDKQGHPVMYDEIGTKQIDVFSLFQKASYKYKTNSENINKSNDSKEKEEEKEEKEEEEEEDKKDTKKDKKDKNDSKMYDKMDIGCALKYRFRWWLRTMYLNNKISNYYESVVYKHVLVFNCSEFSFTSLSRQWNLWSKLLKDIIHLEQDLFPETLDKLFIINVPWSFTFFWKIVSQFIDKNILKKIHILGNDYINTMKKFINENQIPKEYGGKSDIPIKYDYHWR